MKTEGADAMLPLAPDGGIAIIGMACLFPGAPDLDAYWENIVAGVDAIGDPPEDAWDARALHDPDGTLGTRIYSRRGGYLGEHARFDPLAHGVMPSTAQGGDSDHWLALQVARQALADAGYPGEVPCAERTMVVLARGSYPTAGTANVLQHGAILAQTIALLESLQLGLTDEDLGRIRDRLRDSLPPFEPDSVPGLIPNIAASRIANRLNLMGPSYTVDAACASSLIAVDLATRDLASGRCDLALVGGVHLPLPSSISQPFCTVGAFSGSGRLRPFDRQADGTLPGEGVGMVVLKPLAAARRDGDRIYAVIQGVGTSSDGRGMSVMAPRLEGQILALERAYQAAGVAPRSIGLIEAHGTGTQVGDLTEIRALTQLFGPREGRVRRCAVGSVKSMIGHLMPAAGIAGLIKATLALYHRVLPPTLHVEEPNPELELERTPLYLNTATRPWFQGRTEEPRRAGVSAFGFGGINAHLVLEEHPVPDESALPSHARRWEAEVFIVAAASRERLIGRVEEIRRFLQRQPQLELRDLAYTLNIPADPGPARLAIVASSVEDLEKKLERALQRLSDPGRRQIRDARGIYYFDEPLGRSGELAFLFPGEGSQYPDMLADLCMHFPELRARFELTDHAFAEQGFDLLPTDFIFPHPTATAEERTGAETRLWSMDGAVSSVLTADYALLTLLRRLKIAPAAVLGHSTGEFAAMFASGMIDLADGALARQFSVELFQMYQRFTTEEELPRVALVAVGAESGAVTEVLEQSAAGGEVLIAMDNCPHQTVIAGEPEAVARLVERLAQRGYLCERLPFDRPYHTRAFEPLAPLLRDFYTRWVVSPPSLRAYTCAATGGFSADLEQARALAVEQWLRPVAFRQTVEEMYADGVRLFVEVGPRGNLSAFVEDILRERPHLAVPVNVPNRSGILQLAHLIGLLAAHGVPMDLECLYARRSPRRLDLEAPPPAPAVDRQIPLATGWPLMRLSEDAAAELRLRHSVTPMDGVPLSSPEPITSVVPVVPAGAAPAPAASDLVAQHTGSARLDAAGVVSGVSYPAAPAGDAAQVLEAHLATMSRFLEVQQEVMLTYLSVSTESPVALTPPTAGDAHAPLLPAAPIPHDHPAPAGPLPAAEAAPAAAQAPPAPGGEALQELLLQLVSERTGYPSEMLDLDLDLEADLGIDSIKRVEILGALQQRSERLAAQEMEALSARRTLRGILELLQECAADVPDAAVSSVAPLPLIGRVIALDPEREVTVERVLDVEDTLFLRDHTFGRRVSRYDADLLGLPVMPLTASMELMAEAASLLAPGQRLVGMRQVRGFRWITLQDGPVSLYVVARKTAAHEVEVEIRAGGAAGERLVQGVMVFAADYPSSPHLERALLRNERPGPWTPPQLHEEYLFHGPSFAGITSFDTMAEDGARVTLRVPSRSGLLRGVPSPTFLADPVVLDIMGQVAGLWATAHYAADSFFPFQVEEVRLFGSPLPEGEQVQCHAHISQATGEQVSADLAVVREDGRVWLQCIGWTDRRLTMPADVRRFLLSPKDTMLAKPLPRDHSQLPTAARSYRLGTEDFPPDLFSAGGGIWLHAIAHTVLGRAERRQWRVLPAEQGASWLIARIAAKDAVRAYLAEHHGLALCPADVTLTENPDGTLVAAGAWTGQLDEVPRVGMLRPGEAVILASSYASSDIQS
ncbi:hypothetical protein BH23GEM7_BH23GEM7_05840 [soil metagenome]